MDDYTKINNYYLNNLFLPLESNDVLLLSDRVIQFAFGGTCSDGSCLYELISEYRNINKVIYDSPRWFFVDKKTMNLFLNEIKKRGVNIIDTIAKMNNPNKIDIEITKIGSAFYSIKIPFCVQSKQYLLQNNYENLFLQDKDNKYYYAFVTKKQKTKLIKHASNQLYANYVINNGIKVIPEIKGELGSAGLIKLSIQNHPLQMGIMIVLNIVPQPVTPWRPYEAPEINNLLLTLEQWQKLKETFEPFGVRFNLIEPNALTLNKREFISLKNDELYKYQVEGVNFLAKKGLNALLADEMGLGKTAQAICAAEGCSMERILVVVPSIARWVWHEEIINWGNGDIYHIDDKINVEIPDTTKWVIVTYDILVDRKENIIIAPRDSDFESENKKFAKAMGISNFEEHDISNYLLDRGVVIKKTKKGIVASIKQPIKIMEGYYNKDTMERFDIANRRLSKELYEKIKAWDTKMIICDEAHKLKNKASKRSKAINEIIDSTEQRRVLLLTGTPVRNHNSEIKQLLSIIDPAINNKKNNNKEIIKSCLNQTMIRRTKKDVCTELPEIYRQKILLPLDNDLLEEYYFCMSEAWIYYFEHYNHAISSGFSHSQAEIQAKQSVIGIMSKARKMLGIMKAKDHTLQELIISTAQKKRIGVFCHHHKVLDIVNDCIKKAGIRSVLVDGRSNSRKKAEMVEQYNNGDVDVFVAGITVMESISIPDTDLLFFLEFPWVPAEVLQAEARAIRAAIDLHKKINLHSLQVVAKIDEPNIDAYIQGVLINKLDNIASIYDDDSVRKLLNTNISSQAVSWLLNMTKKQ